MKHFDFRPLYKFAIALFPPTLMFYIRDNYNFYSTACILPPPFHSFSPKTPFLDWMFNEKGFKGGYTICLS